MTVHKIRIDIHVHVYIYTRMKVAYPKVHVLVHMDLLRILQSVFPYHLAVLVVAHVSLATLSIPPAGPATPSSCLPYCPLYPTSPPASRYGSVD